MGVYVLIMTRVRDEMVAKGMPWWYLAARWEARPTSDMADGGNCDRSVTFAVISLVVEAQ